MPRILIPLRSEFWNAEDHERWFADCSIAASDIRQAVGSFRAPEKDCWIYVEKSGLDEQLAAFGKKTNLSENTYIPPYLRLALDVINILQIDHDNQPKAEEIRLKVEELAQESGLKMTGRLLFAMTSFVRESERRAGRAAPSPRPVRVVGQNGTKGDSKKRK